jgi:hypothetical protein
VAWYEDTTWCDGCGVEITWGPVLAEGLTYCCRDCSHGYSCACGERMELDEEQRSVESASTPANSGYMT